MQVPATPTPSMMAPIETPVVVNHLFLARKLTSQQQRKHKNATIVVGPTIAPLFDSEQTNTSAKPNLPNNNNII